MLKVTTEKNTNKDKSQERIVEHVDNAPQLI